MLSSMIFVVVLSLGCQAAVIVPKYENIGCFKDKKDARALPDLLGNLRGKIDWKNARSSFNRIIQSCSILAREKGFKYFGIQYYGECWSGPHAHQTFYKYGRSKQCLLGSVGKGCANRVYMLLGPDRKQCSKGNYHTLSEKDRSLEYYGNENKCDNPLPHGNAWYRFTGDAGNTMATSAGSKYSCNTINPGWMRGAAPDVTSGPVDRTVCFVSDERWESNDCKYQVKIKAMNCGHFFVYKLPVAPRCTLRYCGALNPSLPVDF